MADDPPLDDIVSKTYEAGASGRLPGTMLKWNAAIYHAMNHDDIHFINNNAQNGLGYFDNVGRTRRDGLIWVFQVLVCLVWICLVKVAKFHGLGSYGYVNATYDSNLDLVSDANSSRTYTRQRHITASFDDDALISSQHQKKHLGGIANALRSALETDGITFEDSDEI
jgi:hypothetical protein